MGKTYSLQDVLKITIDELGSIRLPAAEIEAIHTIVSAMNNLAECIKAIENVSEPEKETEENEVVDDV